MCGRYPISDHFPWRYCLICPDTRQIQYLCSYRDLDDLWAFFRNERSWLEHPWWLWSTLARPVTDLQSVPAYKPSRNTAPSAIEKLPNELLDEILDYLSEDKKDILALGLSSAILWSLVHYRVQTEYQRSAGIWAGKKVVYLGRSDYDTYLGLKGPLFDESQPFHTALAKLQYMPRHPRTPEMRSVITKSVGQEWAEALASARRWNSMRWDSIAESDWKSIEKDLSPSIFPQDRVWLLRNLTTCEFIRSDMLQPSAQRKPAVRPSNAGKGIGTLSLGAKMVALFKQGAAALKLRKSNKQVTDWTLSDDLDQTPLMFAQIFLVLACYSRQVPYDEQCFEFQEGRWAGHAFDIVTLDAHTTETKPHEWADVSELAVDDVANLRHWVQQLKKAGMSSSLYQLVSEDRRMYHDWEGLDPQSSSGHSGWSQKPVRRGLLFTVQLKGESSKRG
ncbi:hypothetical protein K458DRAFT_391571 [Lentithecium fluviatile CBS 122367]|uniref:F-box domain-containing protein n=1 Tax=Lentithecium fluviatile CBS 122367 TaxID=1168545 RepID=A0A6G1IUQ5_9PLEO|nr:hypothetical protein K458DRAFT_391571 [Lentithecium fluviatile CBS 122367]